MKQFPKKAEFCPYCGIRYLDYIGVSTDDQRAVYSCQDPECGGTFESPVHEVDRAETTSIFSGK